MATFRVHEDIEKENRLLAPVAGGNKSVSATLGASTGIVSAPGGKNFIFQTIGNQQQHHQHRTTFSVLSNVQTNVTNVDKATKDSRGKTHRTGGTIVLPWCGKSGKVDENGIDSSKLNLQTKATKKSSTSSDGCKGFEVYDDSKENLTELSVPKKDEILHGKRPPLQELKHADLFETPMSVGETYSPMSVDKSTTLTTATVDDVLSTIPRNDRERFFEVEEYQEDILAYLKGAEKRNRPKPGYMLKQTDITHSMRTILVDWLVEVSEEYKLQGETLALAVSYIDRFLSFMSVVRAKLQLVGTAAMFIAAKYEEIYPPDVGEFVYITDDTYTKTQVLRMEQLILKVLSFDLTVPTTLVFTNTYCIMNDVPDKIKYLTMYLCELSLLEADPYLTYMPSKIAAGALALARCTLNLPMWSKVLEDNTGYKLSALKDIILDLNKTHVDADVIPQQAIQEKYKSKIYNEVATLPAAAILTAESFDKICEVLFNPAAANRAPTTACEKAVTTGAEHKHWEGTFNNV
ncbi:G2/mitotic-specific cyclin-A [Anopheles nili]|uniref:G2/mitotic-specific cyclin-A n=1 Tax=Anopheles nili TaxID=185578 RepID=UPI00237A808D|nr:G2/mitotic-specific cyclin-A [Anopheles nili]